MRTASRSGQSILEYTLILGVVIGAIVLVLFQGDNSIQKSVESAYTKTGSALDNTVTDLGLGVFADGEDGGGGE